MKSPENSVRRPPALVENPGFYAVVLCCSVLFYAVVFVSARKAVRYRENVAKPRPKRQKSLEPAKEKTKQQCLIINKKIIWTVSIHLHRAWIFENATATFSWTGLPLEVDQFSMVSTLSIFICGTFFCGWMEKSQKFEPAKKFCAKRYSKLNYWIMQF